MTGATDTVRLEPGAGEEVVLLDESARPIGSIEKLRVHTSATPLHLAFSCYVFGPDGRVLLTRRALSKPTWPGVWTNSFCGHPAPGERIEDAVVRRARQELGADIDDLQLVLPDFRYRATDASGIVENEVCPVYAATLAGDISPSNDEVAEWAWVDRDALTEAVTGAPFAFSPWMVLQLPALSAAVTSPSSSSSARPELESTRSEAS